MTDFIKEEEALEILKNNYDKREVRIKEILEKGFPAYTTGCAWSGYDNKKVK